MTHRISFTAWLAASLASVTASAGVLQVNVSSRDGQPLVDAVVIVEPVGNPKAASPASAPVTIDQQRMQFIPAVAVVTRGSTLRFTNRDGWDHHVRGIPLGNLAQGDSARGFEMRLAGHSGQGEPASQTVLMDRAGPFQLGCHLHSSMRGAVFVTDSPWHGKTDAQGVMRLQDVPDGPARIRVWHADQLVDTAAVDVTVQALTVASVPTQITPRRRRP
ncbi:MAG: plastocyanin [Hydrogenophaga sp.]|nr:plastocyanin [Hydrogenophaga sp.]